MCYVWLFRVGVYCCVMLRCGVAWHDVLVCVWLCFVVLCCCVVVCCCVCCLRSLFCVVCVGVVRFVSISVVYCRFV